MALKLRLHPGDVLIADMPIWQPLLNKGGRLIVSGFYSSDVVMVIPQHFSRDIVRKRNPQVLIAANAVNGTKGSIGNLQATVSVTVS